MHGVLNYVKKYLKKVWRKLKKLFSSRTVQVVLTVCCVGLSVYVLGKCRAKYCLLKTRKNGATPSAPAKLNEVSREGLQLASWSDFLGTLNDFLFEKDTTKLYGQPMDPFYPESHPFMAESKNVMKIMKYGFPGSDNVIFYNDVVFSYNNMKKVANWVYEHLTPEKLQPNDKLDITAVGPLNDKMIHPFFKTQPSDFYTSGYYRRQLANPSHHQNSFLHVQETYLMSNMVPQLGINCWSRLEKYVQSLINTHPNIYCCTGTLFLPKLEKDGKKYITYELIGKSKLAVPSHYFKFIILESEGTDDIDVECYMLENKPVHHRTPLNNLMVDPEFVERSAGLLFLNNLHRGYVKTINGVANPHYEPLDEVLEENYQPQVLRIPEVIKKPLLKGPDDCMPDEPPRDQNLRSILEELMSRHSDLIEPESLLPETPTDSKEILRPKALAKAPLPSVDEAPQPKVPVEKDPGSKGSSDVHQDREVANALTDVPQLKMPTGQAQQPKDPSGDVPKEKGFASEAPTDLMDVPQVKMPAGEAPQPKASLGDVPQENGLPLEAPKSLINVPEFKKPAEEALGPDDPSGDYLKQRNFSLETPEALMDVPERKMPVREDLQENGLQLPECKTPAEGTLEPKGLLGRVLKEKGFSSETPKALMEVPELKTPVEVSPLEAPSGNIPQERNFSLKTPKSEPSDEALGSKVVSDVPQKNDFSLEAPKSAVDRLESDMSAGAAQTPKTSTGKISNADALKNSDAPKFNGSRKTIPVIRKDIPPSDQDRGKLTPKSPYFGSLLGRVFRE